MMMSDDMMMMINCANQCHIMEMEDDDGDDTHATRRIVVGWKEWIYRSLVLSLLLRPISGS